MEVSLDITGFDGVYEALLSFDSAMLERVHNQLVQWCELVKASAQMRARVRTGYLRDHIYVGLLEYWVLEIGSAAWYSYFIEAGTRYMAAHPFMWPAIQEYLPALETLLIAAINRAKMDVGL